MKLNLKNLRRGDLITIESRNDTDTSFIGDAFMVRSVSLPFVYTERYNEYVRGEHKFQGVYELDTRNKNLMRISKNAIKPLA